LSFNIMIDDAVVEAERLFSSYGTPIIVPGRDIPMMASEADALIIRSRTPITESLLTENPRIRFIGSTVVGLDHVDQEACQRHGVTFYSAQGCNARSVAEYVISQVVRYAVVQHRTFDSLTLAIIGVGHVGKQVAQLAGALNIKLLLNDPFRAENDPNFTQSTLTHCLQEADIITLHTPLTHTGTHPTYHLIHLHNIALIKKNALFINAARGDIVDETALLTRNDLSLITDCWHNEPHINQSLLNASLLATPHIAGHAWDAKYRGGSMAADALAQWLGKTTQPHPNLIPDGEEIKSPALPLEEGWSKGLTAQQQLDQILKQTYNFYQDDAILRNALESTRAEKFEAYRRDYPIRREWAQQALNTSGLSTQSIVWLKRLGFNI